MARMNNPQNGPQNKPRSKRSSLRYWLLAGAFACGAAILVGRLAWLQIAMHDEYRIQAANQQLKDVAVTPTRGQIYDANGKVLAKSSIVWTLAHRCFCILFRPRTHLLLGTKKPPPAARRRFAF